MVGRMSTSLTKACGACVTSMATTWAMSSAWSIFEVSLPGWRPNEVSVEPGQTTETRMLCERRGPRNR